MSPRQMSPRQMSPRQMSPRQMSPRQMSPRQMSPRQPSRLALHNKVPSTIATRGKETQHDEGSHHEHQHERAAPEAVPGSRRGLHDAGGHGGGYGPVTHGRFGIVEIGRHA